jgi:hypothetical protein
MVAEFNPPRISLSGNPAGVSNGTLGMRHYFPRVSSAGRGSGMGGNSATVSRAGIGISTREANLIINNVGKQKILNEPVTNVDGVIKLLDIIVSKGFHPPNSDIPGVVTNLSNILRLYQQYKSKNRETSIVDDILRGQIGEGYNSQNYKAIVNLKSKTRIMLAFTKAKPSRLDVIVYVLKEKIIKNYKSTEAKRVAAANQWKTVAARMPGVMKFIKESEKPELTKKIAKDINTTLAALVKAIPSL